MEFSVTLPNYFEDIKAIVAKHNWFIHNFDIDESQDLYDPTNYLYNQEFKDVSYTAVLDLNIFQFLINCTKKPKPHPSCRAAAALLVFCQVSQIVIEPCYAIYERINYKNENLNEALSDLQLFRNLDNGNMDELATFALGSSDVVEVVEREPIDRNDLGKELLKYQKLTDWDSMYLIVLAIIGSHIDETVPQPKKLAYFLNQIIRDFRLSLPSVMYAVRLFGKRPLKKMMKFRMDQDKHKKRKAVFNMTWDLYLMSRFFKYWTDKDSKSETIFISNDNALRAVLKLSIDVQGSGRLDPITQYLEPDVFQIVQNLLESRGARSDRIYGTDKWNSSHRANLIAKLERSIFP